jgi:serine/threonine protein kinase
MTVNILGKWRNTVDVAIKTLKPGAMTAEDFLQEAKLMHKLRHRKLVQLLAVCTNTEPILIITELMVNGALLDYLRKDEGRSLKFVVLVDMASQVRGHHTPQISVLNLLKFHMMNASKQ